MEPPAINEAEIIAYYDQCEVDYRIVWHLDTMMCMHYGYWDETTPNLRSALNNMNKKLAGFVEINQGDKVLDAGCGVGGSAIFLAKNYQCQVTGITLSEKQVERAGSNVDKYQLEPFVDIQRQNYLHTSFPDNTFDIVWAIESVCYAFDKKDFLKEAFRVLKPGGKLVVADFFSKPIAPQSPDAQLMNKWTSTWAIKAYAETGSFQKKMDEVGFHQNKTRNVTKHVLPSIKRLYWSFFPGVVITHVSQLMGFRNKIQTANTWSTYYQYKAYKKGLWEYNFITGEKPTK